MSITVQDICRYPIKGLNAEHLDRVTLAAGEGLPHDRRFAIAHGSTKFDASAPTWLPKSNFLMLMRDEKLAQLNAHFEPDSGMLSIERGGKQVVRAKITEPMGKTLIGQFIASFMAGATRGTPRLVEAPGHMFSDVRHKCVSIINIASVKDLERVVRDTVDPLRFRANIYVDGAAAWSEFEWIGKEITLGTARLKVSAPIDRCAATNVNPETAQRDRNIPLSLQRGFGHTDMGIYADVIDDGVVATGDALMLGD